MDGVLVDLFRQIFKYRGLPFPEPWPAGKNAREVLGTNKFPEFNNEDFWTFMPWMHDGKEILKFLEDRFEVFICSTPSGPESASGKLKWIARNIPQYSRKYVLTPVKKLCKDGFLVDDYEKNVDSYCGRSLLLPRPWNRNHDLSVFESLAEYSKKDS